MGLFEYTLLRYLLTFGSLPANNKHNKHIKSRGVAQRNATQRPA